MFHSQSVSLEAALKGGVFPPLETFPSPFDPGERGVIRIVFPEFTCVCPKTGYPDFAQIQLFYLPEATCLELKSWKLYLNAFRMIGTYHESLVAHLFRTITDLVAPHWALLVGDFLPRGNVDTTVLIETPTPRPPGVDLLAGTQKPLCRAPLT